MPQMEFCHLELFQSVECIYLNVRAFSPSPSVNIRQNFRGSDTQDVLQGPFTFRFRECGVKELVKTSGFCQYPAAPLNHTAEEPCSVI